MLSETMKIHLYVALIMCAFLSVHIFGSFTLIGMREDAMGNMNDCPLAQGTGLCAMNLFEHLSLWNILTAAIPNMGIALAFFAIILRAISLLKTRAGKSPKIYERSATYERIIPRLTIRQEFAQGILHPRLA